MDPPHRATDTEQVHLHHRHSHKLMRVSRDDASNKGMMPVAPPSLTQTGQGFHPENPVLQGMQLRNGAPNRENDVQERRHHCH
jgi:hypothetical protein